MWRMRLLRRIPRVALAGGLVLIAAGCGGGKKPASISEATPSAAGAKVFASARCGSCHTLQEARAKGTLGPNLDQLRPSAERVVRQVRNGGAGMPSFRGKLSDRQISDVADFVAAATRRAAGIPAGFKPDGTKLEDCPTAASENRCYEQAFANLAYEDGPRAALDEFQRLEARNRAVFVNCHQIAHMIGAGGLLHFEGNVGKAFAEGNSTCGSGYYHGLLQWKLAGVESSQVAAIAREVCNDPEIKANGFNYYQCDHGLGHGLMLYTAYDLPQALRFCHKLQSNFDQTSCTGGVFMENLSSSFGVKTNWLDKKNLLYPCDSKLVSENDKTYCYTIVAQRILPAVDYDWGKTADWCRRSEPGWADECFQSFGRSVASATRSAGRATVGAAAARMQTLCHKAGSGEQDCITGAVIDVLNNNSTDLTVKAFCNTVRVASRNTCYRAIGFMVALQHPDAAGRQEACRQFATNAENYAQCLSRAKA
jgi:mono/diheme cytochrome c family protein